MRNDSRNFAQDGGNCELNGWLEPDQGKSTRDSKRLSQEIKQADVYPRISGAHKLECNCHWWLKCGFGLKAQGLVRRL